LVTLAEVRENPSRIIELWRSQTADDQSRPTNLSTLLAELDE